MNQVKEKRIGNLTKRLKDIIRALKDIIKELSISEGTSEIKNELGDILAAEDGDTIEKLQNEVTTTCIPLDDNVVPKAKVSEELAMKRAKGVEKIKSEKIKDEK